MIDFHFLSLSLCPFYRLQCVLVDGCMGADRLVIPAICLVRPTPGLHPGLAWPEQQPAWPEDQTWPVDWPGTRPCCCLAIKVDVDRALNIRI